MTRLRVSHVRWRSNWKVERARSHAHAQHVQQHVHVHVHVHVHEHVVHVCCCACTCARACVYMCGPCGGRVHARGCLRMMRTHGHASVTRLPGRGAVACAVECGRGVPFFSMLFCCWSVAVCCCLLLSVALCMCTSMRGFELVGRGSEKHEVREARRGRWWQWREEVRSTSSKKASRPWQRRRSRRRMRMDAVVG